MKEPNWNAFKKATGIELEILKLKKRVDCLEQTVELILNEQKKQKETNSGSSEV